MRRLILIGLLGFIVLGHAADGREAVLEFKYRQGVMRAIGGHMDAVTAIMRGDAHGEDLSLHAKSLAELAALVPGVFPEGSNVARSEALPAIWDEAERFETALQTFIEHSRALDEAVAAEDGVRDAFTALGRSCKSCHDNFRK